MDTSMETECGVLEERFQNVLCDMKNSFTVWDDFTVKAGRLHTSLKTTTTYLSSFLESFQKLADCATSTRGSTRDIGSAMTRLCLRHRSIDSRLKVFTTAIMDSLVVPLQERMDDWKKNVATLDREHAKEYKKAVQEIRKASSDTQRLEKKVKKGKNECRADLNRAVQEGNEKLMSLHCLQKSSVKAALVEERSRLCLFISCLKPVMDEEVAMLTEVTHIQEILHNLCMLAGDPEGLHAFHDPRTHDTHDERKEMSPGKSAARYSVTQNSLAAQTTPGSPSSGCSLASSGGSIGSTQLYSPTHLAQYTQRAQSQVFPSRFSLSQEVDRASQITLSSENQPMSSSADCSAGGERSGSTVGLYHASSVIKRQKDPGAHADRPHTISSAYERGMSRPGITPETYLPPSDRSSMSHQNAPSYLRTQSYTNPGPAAASSSDASHYAVPCVTRKQSNVKVADIYARPSLIPAGSGGYRTPNIRPLPVATPTVPDFEPTFPVAGYVNMNQLASLAMQRYQMEQQMDGVQKTSPIHGARDQHKEVHDFRHGLDTAAAHHDANPQKYYSVDRQRGSSGSGSSRGSEGVDMNAIADRLEYVSRLSSVDKYCTLSHQPRSMLSLSSTSGNTQMFSGTGAMASSSRDSSSNPVKMPCHYSSGGFIAASQGEDSDRDSPVFN